MTDTLKPRRRGFLQAMTFGMFEAICMKEVGVASPTDMTAPPKKVYLVSAKVTDNHDEGWFYEEGESPFRLWTSEAAADRDAVVQNRHDVRTNWFDGAMSASDVEGLFEYWDPSHIYPPGRDEFLQQLRKYYHLCIDEAPGTLPESDDALLDLVREKIADYVWSMPLTVPDEFVDMFAEQSGHAGYFVREMTTADLDPELLKKLQA